MSQQEMLRRAGLGESQALAVLTTPNTLPTEPLDLIDAADARLGPIVIPRFSGHAGKVFVPIQRRHKQRDTAPKVDRAKAKAKRKAARKAKRGKS